MTGRMEEDVHSIRLGKKGKTISVKYHFLPTVSAKVTANFKQKQSRVESRYSWVPGHPRTHTYDVHTVLVPYVEQASVHT